MSDLVWRQVALPSQRVSILFYACAALVMASVFFGGGTRAGFLSDVILQVLAVPVLAIGLWRLVDTPVSIKARRALLFCCALVLLLLFQLLPLPPSVWTALPGRSVIAENLRAAGVEISWMPISVSPGSTRLGILGLIPPAAIFLAALLSSYRERRLLSLIFLSVGVLSALLGLLQVAQGPSSPLRFFATTNPTEAVGFFANRNHFAAFLYCLILFAAAWAIGAVNLGARSPKRYDNSKFFVLISCFTVLVIFIAAEIMARSRAGLGLTILALLGIFALPTSGLKHARSASTSTLLLAAVGLAFVFALQFALYRVFERFRVRSSRRCANSICTQYP